MYRELVLILLPCSALLPSLPAAAQHLTTERATKAWSEWQDLGPSTDYEPLARGVCGLIEALLLAVEDRMGGGGGLRTTRPS